MHTVVFSNEMYEVKAIPIKILMWFFTEIEKTKTLRIHVEVQKTQKKTKAIWNKKSDAGDSIMVCLVLSRITVTW